MTEVPKLERLQKVLAQRGVGSRREIESWITAGFVQVNGKVAVLGTKVTPTDHIAVKGHTIAPAQAPERVILYNKPTGQICTRKDPEGRITVFSKLPRLVKQRWINIGRLDINSSGLILFTTNGELAHALMHPKANIEREYAVRVLGNVTDEMLHRVQTGVTLDDGHHAKFNSVKASGGAGANKWFNVTLSEGRYREVRRIWETQGVRVSRLIRVRYGPFKLPRDLPEGKYEELDYEKIQQNFKK